MWLPYIKSCVRQYHASTNLEVRISFLFLVCLLDKAKSKMTKARNDGGPLEQPKQMISADSPATPTAVQVPYLISLMTHKCRGSIIVLSISKSVEPNKEQK